MRRWWARLAFSLIVIALVLAWEGRKSRQRGGDPTWHYVAAAVFGALGIAGIRERHSH